MPGLHSGQVEVMNHPARFKVMSAGRRWGKTRVGTAMCTATGMNGGRAWWVAPSYPIANIGWRGLKGLAKQIPGAVTREMDRIIYFPGGGTVQVRSADSPDGLRGEGLDLLVMDECAFIKEDAWTQALRPTLSDRKGKALFISTPKGRNWFWRIFQSGQDEARYDWMSWKLPTTTNPFIDPLEVEAARESLPERIFQQEYLAEFLDDGGGVFRNILNCAKGQIQPVPIADHTYCIGCDWGKMNDWTCFVVVDLTTREVVYLDRFNQIDYVVQSERLKALNHKFQPIQILAEKNSIGDPIIERLWRDNLPIKGFQTTAQSKALIIENLTLAFEQESITLPSPNTQGPQGVHVAALLAELEAFEMERLPAGGIRYAAPGGMHDDFVMALAIAWSAATLRKEPRIHIF